MARTRGTFSNKNEGISLWGVDELLEKVQALGENITDVAAEAMQESADLIEADLRAFMEKHTRPGQGPHTIDALGTVIKKHGSSVSGTTGFKMRNVDGYGNIPVGLPALFLDIGTPHIEPTYFVYYAYKNNLPKILEVQKKVFEKHIQRAMNSGK